MACTLHAARPALAGVMGRGGQRLHATVPLSQVPMTVACYAHAIRIPHTMLRFSSFGRLFFWSLLFGIAVTQTWTLSRPCLTPVSACAVGPFSLCPCLEGRVSMQRTARRTSTATMGAKYSGLLIIFWI